jgi:predicted HicB family RNase H-like nuclease
MKNESTRGRPSLPEGAAATSQIQLRVQTSRKAAYVRMASKQGKTLAEWCFEHLDAASGYKREDLKQD